MTVSNLAKLSDAEFKKVGSDLLDGNQPIRLELGGFSMYPNFLPGDVAVIERTDASSLKRGQVVVVQIENRWIAHRLVDFRTVDNTLFVITQGDSVIRPDKPVKSSSLVGVVGEVLRGNSHIQYSAILAWAYVKLRPLPQIFGRAVLKIKWKLNL